MVLNDYHSGACGGHLSSMVTAKKILLAGYFWPSIFKDCMEAMKKFPSYELFQSTKHTHCATLHPIIVVDPFAKWGIDFMHCKPTLAGGYG